MNISEVLDDYVGDVLRHLPAAMRHDVGFELRALLDDALAERAGAAQAPADYAMALSVLRDFGTPRELAVRYLPDSPPLMTGPESRTFLRVALGGVALQWALTLPGAFTSGTLGGWWLSWGLGALWWPGALALAAAARGWMRERRAQAGRPDDPRVDREAVSRRASRLALWLAALGSAIVLTMPLWRELLPPAGAEAFALAPDFARGRGLLAVPLWFATIGLRVYADRLGRWTPLLRRWRVGGDLAAAVLLAWWSVGPAVFAEPASDRLVKRLLALIALLIVLDIATKWMARGRPITTPPLGD